MTTLTTEFVARRDFRLTVGTRQKDLRSTLTAKPIALGIFRLALWALHFLHRSLNANVQGRAEI